MNSEKINPDMKLKDTYFIIHLLIIILKIYKINSTFSTRNDTSLCRLSMVYSTITHRYLPIVTRTEYRIQRKEPPLATTGVPWTDPSTPLCLWLRTRRTRQWRKCLSRVTASWDEGTPLDLLVTRTAPSTRFPTRKDIVNKSELWIKT